MYATLYDFSPLFRMLVAGALLASGPLLWVYVRHRGANSVGRLHALVLVILFLTFDLVLFGAFTRLTDSGLGCPDWPGCYGSATPFGAGTEISAAQSAMPTGPVTHGKAWVEMVHRYLAMGVGGLILVLAIAAWRQRRLTQAQTGMGPWLPGITLVWVCIQGAFGALTVTMKLFPAIVTLHLLGAYILLALLVVQALGLARHAGPQPRAIIGRGVRLALSGALALLVLQAASGAWVSTNYAVLACNEFPKCQGSWWPDMDFVGAIEIWRPLGIAHDGEHVSFQALTAIHFSHRLLAGITLLALASVAWRLWLVPTLRKPTRLLGALLVLQLATGLSNVVLGWPLVAAVLHTGGAGALVVVMVWLLCETQSDAPKPAAAV
jgi:cytochrome c oxidase assembly protein subunit 15